VDRWSGGDPYQAGRAYAVNIVGCIAGPLLAGFVLLPRMSEVTALIWLTLPLFLAGLFLAFRRGRAETGEFRGGASKPLVAGITLASVLLMGFSFTYQQREAGLVKRDYEAVVVANGAGMRKLLYVNGISMTVMSPITKFMAHLPAAMLPEAPRNSLVICFGMGTTFRSFLSWGIPSTSVDLVPSVPAVFSYFHPDAETLVRLPQAEIIIDDGRRFLKRTNRRYDVIAIDPPPPVEAAYSSLLYSKEFNEIARARLAPEGILQQWLPGGDRATLIAVAKALKESFPYVRVFSSVEDWGLHFLASNRPLPFRTAAEMAQRLPARAKEDLLEWGPQATVTEQFQKILDHEISIDTIVGLDKKGSTLTDDIPVNEYVVLRRVFKGDRPEQNFSNFSKPHGKAATSP
jgi:spermidine synthase